MQAEEEETQAGFLIRNLLKGFAFFFVIVVAFYFVEGYIQDNFQTHIEEIRANPGIL